MNEIKRVAYCSLAYCELYLAFAHLFRRFDVREDPTR